MYAKYIPTVYIYIRICEKYIRTIFNHRIDARCMPVIKIIVARARSDGKRLNRWYQSIRAQSSTKNLVQLSPNQ